MLVNKSFHLSSMKLHDIEFLFMIYNTISLLTQWSILICFVLPLFSELKQKNGKQLC